MGLKKLTSVLIFVIVLGMHAYANNQIEISLLTCSGGKESFTSWGHSAIRVVDNVQATDLIYNFGLFDFNTPNFYMKFIKGKLKYKLGIQKTERFINDYIREERSVIEQKLNLSDYEKAYIVNRLQYLYRPENRYYYYSFLKKNCTTELRDLIFNTIKYDLNDEKIEKTYREQINEYLKDKPCLKVGINLILGSGTDIKINTYESLFLPDYLQNELNSIKIDTLNLVSEQLVLNKVNSSKERHLSKLLPIFIFTILLAILIFVKNKKAIITFFIFVGITGISLSILWAITEHSELKWNYNILWCNPFYTFLALLILFKKHQVSKIVSYILLLFIASMIIVWFKGVQQFEIAIIPIIIALIYSNYKVLKIVE